MEKSTNTVVKWLEKNLGNDWRVIVSWSLIFIAGAILVTILYAVPRYQYSRASFSEKCQIDLKKQNDSDKFCDINYNIQSRQAIAATEAKKAEESKEVARRAALTPKQRCEEDHKGGADPEGGDSYYVFCKDDGTYTIKSGDELQSEAEDDEYTYDSGDSYSGSGYGSLNDAGCVKNQYVSGYYRSNGTYVNGYYRNSPSDNCQ